MAATWVPDEAVDACMICRVEFSLFTRRHHCRRCGRCLCDSCSPVRAYGVGSKQQFRDQRVCPPCCAAIVVADKAQATVATPAAVVTSDQPSLIYQTYSSCAKCAIIDRKGFASDLSLPAEIIEQRGRVYLRCTCPVHGDHTTLYCSDAVFFKRMLSFMDEPVKSNRPPLPELEDLLNIRPASANLPTLVEIDLCRGQELIPDAQLLQHLASVRARFPPQHSFVLKVNGGLARDLPALNEKIAMLETASGLSCPSGSSGPLVVDLSFERLAELAQLPDSVFLRGRVYPCVRYFLVARNLSTEDTERQCAQELGDLLDGLRASISDMQIMLVLSIDRPFPNLNKIFNLVLQNAGFVRFLLISVERSPRALLQRLMQAPSGTEATSAESATFTSEIADIQPDENETIDPYELLKYLEVCTQGQLKVDDFVPARVGMVLEPFLKALGYGQFSIRPSTFCGFAACLVNTDKLRAFPVSRLVDMQRLYRELQPILIRIRANGGEVGLSTANALRKAVKASALSAELALAAASSMNSELVDSSSSNDTPLSESDDVNLRVAEASEQYKGVSDLADLTIEHILQTIKQSQVIIVHNNMDFASIDLRRRCDCACLAASGASKRGVNASCTGCI